MKSILKTTLSIVLLLLAAGNLYASDLDRSYTDLQGKKLRLSDYRGKWVVVNYWATWCPPCKQEIPELIMFHERHMKKDAVVIGVDMEELDRKTLLRFVDDYMISYPILTYGKGFPVLGEVPGLPTTYLIDPQGQVVARQVGMVDGQMLESYMEQYGKKLKQKSSAPVEKKEAGERSH